MSAFLLGFVVAVAVAQAPAPPGAGALAATPDVPISSAPPASLEFSDRYQGLFTPSPKDARQARMRAALEQHRLAAEAARPKIVCGMVVMRADPQIDPQMVKRPAESTATMHIKKIPPAACAE